MRRAVTLLALALGAGVACTPALDHARLVDRLAAHAAAPVPGPGTAWPLPPGDLEHSFVHDTFEVLSHEPIGRGVTGAVKEKVYVSAHGEEFALKWKEVPRSGDGWNNSPRHEIAAYFVQQWFLDPADYVVPTSGLRCADIDAYRRYEADATPTFRGTRCVLGWTMVWLENVTVPDVLYDEERFLADPTYAYHMANFNLLTHLIDHRDGRRGNFLVAADDANRRVYAIDNGIAFGAWFFNYFVPNWNRLRVPAVRRAAVDRLRGVTAADVARLGVVAELVADDDGMLRPVEPTPNLDPRRGVRRRDGRIQLGLTAAELRGLTARLRDLLAGVDAGDIAVY